MILVTDDNHRHGKLSHLKSQEHDNECSNSTGANQVINVSKTLDFRGIDNFRVALEWTEEVDLLYNVSISLPAIATALVSNTSAELTLLYNTPHSVTIAAVTQCGLTVSTTTLNQLSQSE